MGKADAIAVGGGLAGAAFALELSRNGARAVVLERSRAAHLKVCGDFLSAEALELLTYLGLDTAALGATRVGRLTLAAGRSAASAPLPFFAGGLSRLALDEALLAAAGAAGAEVVRGVGTTAMEVRGGGVVLATDRGAFEASQVALATGKHNLRGWPRAPGAVSGFKIQLALGAAARADLAGRVHLTLFDGGYVGACLVEGDLATVCWQIDTEALKRVGPDWRGQLDAFSRQSPRLGDLLAGARPASERPATISNLPFGYVRRAPIAPGVFPIGDQVAVIPAFTGDGTSIALASGIGAARAVLAGESAVAFQHRFAAALGRQFTLARVVNATLRARATRRLTVAAVGALPQLATALARATRLSRAGCYRSSTMKYAENPGPNAASK
jgi:flavin-dependent dehydrogenase